MLDREHFTEIAIRESGKIQERHSSTSFERLESVQYEALVHTPNFVLPIRVIMGYFAART